MIVSVNLEDGDLKRVAELKEKTEETTRSNVIRAALREYHKKIFANRLSVDSNSDNASSGASSPTKSERAIAKESLGCH